MIKLRRNAMTLVELLVVIAIIAALIALLLPAVAAVRESSRRVQCKNNLRQLSLAVLNYETSRARLPAAGAFAPPSGGLFFRWGSVRVDLQSGSNHSWIVSLLPMLEQAPLYQQFNLKQHVGANADDPQAEQPATLLCPSDAAAGRMFRHPDIEPSKLFGKANYAAFASPFHIDDLHTTGAIRLYGQRMAEIADGVSQTLALSEVRTREHEDDQRGAWALPWSGASLLALDMHPTWYPLTNSNVHQSRPAAFEINPAVLGKQQTPNGARLDVLYQCPDVAAEQLERMPCSEAHRQYISAAPRSNHPGGVNAARLDASVEFITDDVDAVAMAYLIATDDDHAPPSP